MEMDHLIGQRFNLISKSEIRYVGTLHEINPEQSTIALEDVYSYGTEGRKAEKFVPASHQRFDYIVFRGSDVKDIKIADDQKENKQPEPPSMPNDPAIVNSSRPNQPPQGRPQQARGQSPFHHYGYPLQQQPQQFGGYYPQQYGRGYGPAPGGFPPGGFPPGPSFQGMPYGPPPQAFFASPGQALQGNGNHFPPPPIGPPGQRPPGPDGLQAPLPPGPVHSPKPTSELPVEDTAPPNALSKRLTPVASSAPTATHSIATADASTPLIESMPLISKAAPTAPSTTAVPPALHASNVVKAPSGPKSTRVTPAFPMTVNSRSFTPPVPVKNGVTLSSSSGNVVSTSAKPLPSAAAMAEASEQAKKAVAAAMAKLDPQSSSQSKPAPSAGALDSLTKKVNEMRTADVATRSGVGGERGGERRGSRGSFRGHLHHQQNRKIEIPKSDYDFESANAKFNKDDLIKEAIASESPIGETPEARVSAANALDGELLSTNGEDRKDSLSGVASSTQAYNKSSSFFDNISSESKDREEGNTGLPPGGRGSEYKKNFETFGQGSVDGGGYRGRGRGGLRGRSRAYGAPRGYGSRGSLGRNSGLRGRTRGDSEVAQS